MTSLLKQALALSLTATALVKVLLTQNVIYLVCLTLTMWKFFAELNALFDGSGAVPHPTPSHSTVGVLSRHLQSSTAGPGGLPGPAGQGALGPGAPGRPGAGVLGVGRAVVPVTPWGRARLAPVERASSGALKTKHEIRNLQIHFLQS